MLSLGALGVVYGDIGTSPLYALRECFHGPHAVAVNHDNVLGVLSLIFWSLIIIISVKYLAFVMRADNRGEGGILALMALVRVRGRHSQPVLIGLGLFGAALLYGDGMITPAISVLSAVEGLEVATPLFRPYVMPLTIVVLVLLFVFQARGTARVGAVFGPVMIVWFTTLAILGALAIASEPRVLEAIDPRYAVLFFIHTGWIGFVVLGAVFLVVTGGEALYADMGHFGKRPIRIVWFAFVLPALLANYFGQGALLLGDPEAAPNPFYHLAPDWLLYPLVVLSTLATVIASQAVISGAFSLTRQAVSLGYCPRVDIRYTSPEEIGQIYIPQVNWALLVSTIGLVLGFKTSSSLAAAYGVAVTTTMVITTLLLFMVARWRWQWSLATALTITMAFLVFDLAFFVANMLKIAQGGWFPLVVGGVAYLLMTTWNRGRAILAERLRESILPMDDFLETIAANPPTRVKGTAVFMTTDPSGTPQALLHNLKHNRVLHEQVVLFTIATEEIPHVPDNLALQVQRRESGFFRVIARCGFMEEPNVPRLIKRLQTMGLELDEANTTFFLGRETLLVTSRPGMAEWREQLFVLMARNALRATAFFRLPPDRVVELGVQVEL
ncbi:MAG: potassium transporter Kup [Acidobacteria bacterium]|nr:potassium transporter Kup [Acidobacteriota bacterium]